MKLWEAIKSFLKHRTRITTSQLYVKYQDCLIMDNCDEWDVVPEAGVLLKKIIKKGFTIKISPHEGDPFIEISHDLYKDMNGSIPIADAERKLIPHIQRLFIMAQDDKNKKDYK